MMKFTLKQLLGLVVGVAILAAATRSMFEQLGPKAIIGMCVLLGFAVATYVGGMTARRVGKGKSGAMEFAIVYGIVLGPVLGMLLIVVALAIWSSIL
jgi:Na+-driven multidrug efflux pump